MPPIRDFQCGSCGHEYEGLQLSGYEVSTETCPHCESDKVVVLPSRPGGYKFANGSGGASVTPRASGSPKRSKK